MEPRIQYAKTSDGLSIAYCAAGEGAPLVVTPYHSTSHAWMEWQYEPIRLVYERLAWSFRLVRYDRRGTGLSERSSEMSPDSEQGDLEAVMGALGDVRAVLAGRGFAGLAAVRYAVRHPERLSHLVLYDTVASIDEWKSDAFMQAQFAMIKSLVKKDYEGLVRLLSQLGFSSHAEWFASFIRESGSPKNLSLALAFEDDVSDLLPQLRCPTLVIHERHAGLSHDTPSLLARRIPHAQLRVVDRVAGDPWVDMADITDILYEFVGKTSPPPIDRSVDERRSKIAAVPFTDLVGHTGMMSRLGDAHGRNVLREHERTTREMLKAHGGTEVKTMGDGFMASFGSVTEAVECTIALQRAFAEREGEPLAVRVGLNAGEPIEEDGDLFGATVILASRIAAKAEGGEILVADTVRGFSSGKGFLFADRGEFVAKGFEEPVHVYEVRWEREQL